MLLLTLEPEMVSGTLGWTTYHFPRDKLMEHISLVAALQRAHAGSAHDKQNQYLHFLHRCHLERVPTHLFTATERRDGETKPSRVTYITSNIK